MGNKVIYDEDNILKQVKNELLGGKKIIYITKLEYENLTFEQKNDINIVYSLIDDNLNNASDINIISDKIILVDANGNKIGNGSSLNNSTLSGKLISPSGKKFELVVDDNGNLSTVEYIEPVYGDILVSEETIIIREGTVGILNIKLDTAITRNQTINIVMNNQNINIDKTQIVFTKDNYNINQQITITVNQDSLKSDYYETITLNCENCNSKNVSIYVRDNSQSAEIFDGIIQNRLKIWLDARDVRSGDTVWLDRTTSGANATLISSSQTDTSLVRDTDVTVLMSTEKYLEIDKTKIPLGERTIEYVCDTIPIWGALFFFADKSCASGNASNTGLCLIKESNPSYYNAVVTTSNNKPKIIQITLTTSYVKIYERGQLLLEKQYDFSTLINFTTNFFINARYGGGDKKGTRIYSFRLYDRILSDQELINNSNADMQKYNSYNSTL